MYNKADTEEQWGSKSSSAKYRHLIPSKKLCIWEAHIISNDRT